MRITIKTNWRKIKPRVISKHKPKVESNRKKYKREKVEVNNFDFIDTNKY